MGKDKTSGATAEKKTMIICCENNLAVRPDPDSEMTKGGIVLVRTGKKEDEGPEMRTGVVVSIGPGKSLGDGKFSDMPCSKGDRIIYTSAPYTGGRFKCNGGEEVDLIGSECVYAILKDA